MAALSFGMYVVYGQTASSIGDSMHIISDLTVDGSVGIGTASPGAKVEINNGGTTRAVVGTGINSGSTTTGINFKHRYGPTFADGEVLSYVRSLRDGTGGTGHLTFGTSGVTGEHATERVRITDGGNVGIGTTTPRSKLDVRDNINSHNIWSNSEGVNTDSAEPLKGPDGNNLGDFQGIIYAGVRGTSGSPSSVWLVTSDPGAHCAVTELGRVNDNSRTPIIFCETDDSLALRINGHTSTYGVQLTFISHQTHN